MFLLDKSRTTLEDLKEVSQAAHEAKLDTELMHFEHELELFLADKEFFLEDLYMRLKQITSLRKSWRCQRLRDVTITQLVATKQIEELLDWEQNLPGRKTNSKIYKIVREKPVDMLIKFIQACRESRQLYEDFFFNIYKPLGEQFVDERTVSLSKDLGRVLEQWSSLLEPGPINQRMLSAASAEVVYRMNLANKPRGMKFNLVLRLVPDFVIKGYEALFLARQWRNCFGVCGYSKELEFLQKKKQRSFPHQNPTDSSIHRNRFYSLERKLNQSQEFVDMTSTGHVRKETVISMLLKRDYGTDLLNSNQAKVSTAEAIDSSCCPVTSCSCQQRVDRLRANLKREQLRVQRIRTEILQGDLASRYTAEKVMSEPLFDKLASAKANCCRLRSEISKEGEGNFPVLESSRVEFRDSQGSSQRDLSSTASKRIRFFISPLSNSRSLLRSRDHMHQYSSSLSRTGRTMKVKE
ncbi:uncharacterized protein [Montipora capricornis]|uniref:uncharacterized protein isoform X2 n=1 Tax=Montipora foliosa TaxID=591990 RepID=UPI0035F1D94E